MAKTKALALPTPRPEVVAFLDSIKDDPDDDAPRLVLADWLDEHGDEHDAARARYLRLTCERRKMADDDARRATIDAEVEQIEKQHGDAWLGPLADLARVSRHNVSASLNGGGMVSLSGRPMGLTSSYCLPLIGTEAYAWVDRVLVNCGGRSAMAKLFASPVFRRPNALIFSPGYTPMRQAGAEGLAGVGRLASLTWLGLGGNFIGHAGLTALAEAPAFTSLRHLDLSHNQLQGESVRVLAKTPLLRHLRWLDLSRQNHFDDAVRHLAEAEWLGGLRSLFLCETWTVDAGLIALLACHKLAQLETLDLSTNRLTDVSAEAIASCPHLGRLADLRLGGDWSIPGNAVGRRGIEALAASPLLGRLRRLDLGHCRGGGDAEAARLLTGSPHWGSLRVLSLSAMPIGSAGAARLAEASAAGRIDSLSLYRCGIDDAGAGALADAVRRGTIGKVDLRGNNLSAGVGAELRAEFGDRVEARY
jgi:uncharacterized protein (TIGR02996 family)